MWFLRAGFLDEMGAPVDFSARPSGEPAPLLSLVAVHRANSKASGSAAAAAAAAAAPAPQRRPSSGGGKKRPAADDWSDDEDVDVKPPGKKLASGRAADSGEVLQRVLLSPLPRPCPRCAAMCDWGIEELACM